MDSPSIGNDPGVLISSSATPDVGYVSIDVTAAMQDDMNKGRRYTTFMIKMAVNTNNDGNDNYWAFLASEVTGTDRDPYIECSLKPEPVGGVLTPVNKLAVLVSYPALVGIFGAMSTIFVIRRRNA